MGDPTRAHELLHTADPSVRVRGLLADCARDLCEFEDALRVEASAPADQLAASAQARDRTRQMVGLPRRS